PTPDKLHNLGLLNILNGYYTKAIDNLEKALIKDAKNSQILNDLAVAYLERGDQQQQPSDLLHALSLVNQTLFLDSSLLEAKFNCALLLEKNYLFLQAKQSWQEYLTLEKNPDWQKEANSHINNLETLLNSQNNSDIEGQLTVAIEKEELKTIKSVVTQYPHLARIFVLEKLIPQWATLVSIEKQKAIKLIKGSKVIGETLFAIQKDNSVIDIIDNIIEISKDTKKEIILAQAHSIYFQANIALNNYEPSKAKELFQKAKALFSQVKDESSLNWSLFQIARCEMVLSNYQTALILFEKVIKFAQEKKHLYILARSWWATGLIQDYQSDFSKSLTSKSLAIDYLEQINDIESIAVVNMLIAETLVDLKNLDSLGVYQHKALSNIIKVNNSKWVFNIIWGIGKELFRIGELGAASYFYKELNTLANKENNQTYKFSSLLENAQLQQKLGNTTLADSYLNSTYQELENIPDPVSQLSSKQLFLITQAQFKVETEPEITINKLAELEKILTKDDPIYQTSILRLQAKAYLALKEYDKAETALVSSIKLFESQRSKITDERYRLSFFEEPQSIYEDMIKFQINQKQQINNAFDYVELARSRALLDAIDGRAKTIKIDIRQDLQVEGTAKPLDLSTIQKTLPKEIVLIRYLVLSNQIYIWLITKDNFEFVQYEIAEIELEKQILQLRSIIIDFNSQTSNIEAVSNPVYNTVFAPLKPYLKKLVNKQSNLVIIPDKALYAIPFAALIDPETKRYLIEDYTLTIAPSSTIYLHCLAKDRKKATQKESILAIGDPSFVRSHFNDMRYLSGAKEEAETIAKLYPSSTLLLEKQATKEAFLKEAAKYDVVHYAGHALIDPGSPLFSKLLLAAPENASDSYDEALYAHEIYGQNFDKTRLIVLAACKTAGGLRTHGEGMISLARPFLARGVPAVIASLWDADDKASVELFTEFHKQRLANNDSATALRIAQINLLKKTDRRLSHPRMWSLFQVIGGVSPNLNK
ncbi:MAG: CHAT domain-containing protein, partial [Blastocatellia bacterium]